MIVVVLLLLVVIGIVYGVLFNECVVFDVFGDVVNVLFYGCLL